MELFTLIADAFDRFWSAESVMDDLHVGRDAEDETRLSTSFCSSFK